MSKVEQIDIGLVVDYFLHKGQKGNRQISNKKLQKLLYYAQAWSLVIRKGPLFDAPIEAWVHGPAVRDVYLQFKKFGFNPITKPINQERIGSLSSEVCVFLDEVWRIYGALDAPYLEMLTHSERPWQDAREGLRESEISSKEISLDSMRDFYTAMLQNIRSKKAKLA
jgi:uncharacterized phage-associated protein